VFKNAKQETCVLVRTDRHFSAQASGDRPGALSLGGNERRSSNRPRMRTSWCKTIEADAQDFALPGSLGRKSRVDVWIAPTDSLLRAHSARQLLTQSDWHLIDEMRGASAQATAITAKVLLRLGLSSAVDRRVAPSEWEFRRTEYGQALVASPLPDINFSVSHVDALTVVAVSTELGIGIDIEAIDQHVNAGTINDYCHPRERRAICGLPHHQRLREFIRFWTAKEAYSKLVGLGHSIEFASLDTDAMACQSAHFENFFVPINRDLYHASLAIEPAALRRGPVEVQLTNVSGPDELRDTAAHPAAS
jgi:phosphopantetheinyl transferase